MTDIRQWRLCNVHDELVGDEYDSYIEARNVATDESERHAVFELTYELTNTAVVWTHPGCEEDAILYWPPIEPCEHCEDGPKWLRGILLGANGSQTVEACTCQRYASDLAAAFVVADRVVGDVVFWQADAELDTDVERRVYEGELPYEYDPADVGFELRRYNTEQGGQPDDCLRSGEYPWIEVAGRALDWHQHRLINAAFGGGS